MAPRTPLLRILARGPWWWLLLARVVAIVQVILFVTVMP